MKKIVMLVVFICGMVVNSKTIAQNNFSKKVKLQKTTSSFKKIELQEVPPSVINAVKNDFKAIIVNAYINSYKEYKLEIKSSESSSRTVFTNSEGEWIKPTK
ncbi:hypothetical protein [Mesonia phycicola]|nr:hypothetical protein [Mesonia phycicola]